MSETKSHQKAKNQAAGKGGKTEVPLTHGRRLDALTRDGKKATEVERSGISKGIKKAIKRLDDSGAPNKELRVPSKDIPKAKSITAKESPKVSVRNMQGSKKSTKK